MNSRICCQTAVLMFSLLGALGGSSATCQEVDGKKTEFITAFAEKFIVACSKEDVQNLKSMMSLPFFVYAPCKGGAFDSVEDFRDNILRRGNGIKPPTTYQKRLLITPEKYVRSIAPESTREEDLRAHLKNLGKDVHVVCLIQGKKDGDFAFAVLVRVNRDGIRAIGVGGIMPGTISE